MKSTLIIFQPFQLLSKERNTLPCYVIPTHFTPEVRDIIVSYITLFFQLNIYVILVFSCPVYYVSLLIY